MTSVDDKMTPAEVRAFNAGVEAVRELARAHHERRMSCPRIGVMLGGMMGAFRIVVDDGKTLLREPDTARGCPPCD